MAIAGGAAACGQVASGGTASRGAPGGASSASTARPTPNGSASGSLTISYGGTNAGALPLWLAEQLGYFHGEGLRVTLVDAPWNTHPLTRLDAGTVHFVTISMDLLEWDTSCCTAVGKHANAVYLAAAYAVPVFSVLSANAIPSMAALRGKKIGVPGELASAAHYALQTALAAHGLSLADVTPVNGSDAKTYFQDLQQGTLQAAVLPPPMSIRSAQKGLRVLADCSVYGKPYPSAWFATDRGFAAKHPTTVTKVMRAWLRGLQAAQRSPQQAVTAVSNVGGVGQPHVALATYRAYAPLLLKKPYPPLAGVRAALSFLARNYPNDAATLRSVAPASFVDTSFLRQVGA